MKKIVKIISTLILTLIVGLGNINAAETVKNISIKVEGSHKTLIQETKMDLNARDISQYVGGDSEKWKKDVTTMHALVEVFKKYGYDTTNQEQLNLNHTAYGIYINSLLTQVEDNTKKSVMNIVNGKDPQVGFENQVLKDNDQIIIYHLDYFANETLGYFNKQNLDAKENNMFDITIYKGVYDDAFQLQSLPLKNATIIIKDLKANKLITNNYKSDQNGVFELKLKPGKYELVAKSNEVALTRASAIVNVTKDSTSTNTNQNKPKPLPNTKTFKKGNTTYYQKLVGKKYYTTKSVYKKGLIKTTQYYKLIKNKNKLTKKETYTKYKKKNVRTYYNSISYYANGRVKVNTKLHKDKKTNKYTIKYKTTYRRNGKKSMYVKITYKKGKTSKRSEYVYNIKGQLKSNKYGKAYRYITKYGKKGKATRTDRKQYNKKGKLTNNKIVKIRKSF